MLVVLFLEIMILEILFPLFRKLSSCSVSCLSSKSMLSLTNGYNFRFCRDSIQYANGCSVNDIGQRTDLQMTFLGSSQK